MDLKFSKRELFVIGVIILLFFAWSMGSMRSAYFWFEEEEKEEKVAQDHIIIRKSDDYIFALDIQEYEDYITSGPIHPTLRDRFEGEDIELDEHLGALSRENYSSYLENGTIAIFLRSRLERESISLPEDAELTGYDRIWWIVIGGEKRYNLYVMGTNIHIYEVDTELNEGPDLTEWYVLINGEKEYRIRLDDRSYQFSIPRREYEGELVEGNISSRLRDILEEGGILLDEDTQLHQKDGRWEIKEGEDMEYWIEIDRNYLDIYKEEIKIYDYSRNWLHYLFPIFIIGGLIVGAVVSPPDDTFQHLMRGMIAGGLIFFFLMWEHITSFLTAFFTGLMNLIPDVSFPSLPDISFGDPTGSGNIWGMNIMGLVIFFLTSAILLALFLYFRRDKPVTTTKQDKDEKTLKSTAERAIKQLHKGEDIDDVIIRNYQRMCLILEKRGIQQKISFTPREFEKKVLEKTDIREKTIDEMTKLFEKAKYSDHPLDESHRDRAIKNFKQIKSDLEGEDDE